MKERILKEIDWRETFVCDTLEDIMTEVSDNYGCE